VSPVGPYYKTGFKPVKLLATTTDVRAWPGGTGGYKLGSNYACGVVPQMKAAALGFQQILWLFGEERKLTEVGTMNLFAVFKHPDGSASLPLLYSLDPRIHARWQSATELVTPPLEDMILPGVTRDSILTLARAHADPNNPFKLEGLPEKLMISERDMTMPDVVKASEDGTLLEMFGSGTVSLTPLSSRAVLTSMLYRLLSSVVSKE
jgi:branched-chain amino acid aminotransferase